MYIYMYIYTYIYFNIHLYSSITTVLMAFYSNKHSTGGPILCNSYVQYGTIPKSMVKLTP